jgi:hypothetical protein
MSAIEKLQLWDCVFNAGPGDVSITTSLPLVSALHQVVMRLSPADKEAFMSMLSCSQWHPWPMAEELTLIKIQRASPREIVALERAIDNNLGPP